MQILTVYGIPNCDSVKKARAWLDGQGMAYAFVDFKKTGVPVDRLLVWAHAVGWDKLINRRGTTWRKLDAAAQLAADNPQGAQQLALVMPSMIKRPVVQWGDAVVTVGFDAAQFVKTLQTIQA